MSLRRTLTRPTPDSPFDVTWTCFMLPPTLLKVLDIPVALNSSGFESVCRCPILMCSAMSARDQLQGWMVTLDSHHQTHLQLLHYWLFVGGKRLASRLKAFIQYI
jgi:hypothetical protein